MQTGQGSQIFEREKQGFLESLTEKPHVVKVIAIQFKVNVCIQFSNGQKHTKTAVITNLVYIQSLKNGIVVVLQMTVYC